jgi:hypothetical protein
VRLDRVVVLEEDISAGGLLESAAYLADRLCSLLPANRLGLTLRATVLQARGDVAGAARVYAQVGDVVGRSLWSEYVDTADGFMDIGDMERAWREGLSAKLEDASVPEVHRWLANELERAGYGSEAAVEREVAGALATKTATGR